MALCIAWHTFERRFSTPLVCTVLKKHTRGLTNFFSVYIFSSPLFFPLPSALASTQIIIGKSTLSERHHITFFSIDKLFKLLSTFLSIFFLSFLLCFVYQWLSYVSLSLMINIGQKLLLNNNSIKILFIQRIGQTAEASKQQLDCFHIVSLVSLSQFDSQFAVFVCEQWHLSVGSAMPHFTTPK